MKKRMNVLMNQMKLCKMWWCVQKPSRRMRQESCKLRPALSTHWNFTSENKQPSKETTKAVERLTTGQKGKKKSTYLMSFYHELNIYARHLLWHYLYPVGSFGGTLLWTPLGFMHWLSYSKALHHSYSCVNLASHSGLGASFERRYTDFLNYVFTLRTGPIFNY